MLTWCVVLGCALQVAIGATTVLLEDPIFETSCRAEKSFKFWPVRATPRAFSEGILGALRAALARQLRSRWTPE
eukprot:COSAG06_NODE_4286_length_4399_cov_3.887907_7_plen_74_part_00